MSMATSRMIFLSCAIFILLFAPTTTAKPNYQYCAVTGNYTKKSTYESNLNRVLSSINSDTKITYGFYNFSLGEHPDEVHAVGLCRGDLKPDICRSCIRNSITEITNLCPTQKEAIVWYDNCLFRYSDRHIFGSLETGPYFWMYNLNNVSNPREFNQAVAAILGKLTNQAASGDSRLKFATASTTTASSQTIFALVQCTPDLSTKACRECLTNTTRLLPKCCDGRQGGRVMAPSCNFWYEKDKFYN
ncbi:cysteine-rich repeat secretory protein 38-like [Tripterygium wilfordii]|uniref:cysteine-rich repeat secretory protein 38-like n=1 Tax=Tripterygium wilfordii TaxID=458696 RepID=UPI0018F82A03|nr:cysteine-rich repeat secretory protein 38-like [Tripterygium wilfordii]